MKKAEEKLYTELRIQEKLNGINMRYCANDSGPLAYRLSGKKQAEFLIKLMKDYKPDSPFFNDACFYLGKYFKKKYIPIFRDALRRAVDAKEWDVCYQVMVGLDNVGENPFESEREKGVHSFGIQEDEKNSRMAKAYLKKIS